MRFIIAAFIGVILLAHTSEAIACPTPSQSRQSYEVTGEQLYTTRSYNVTAGRASRRLVDCGYKVRGYVASQPDFSFYTSGMERFARLVIQVTAASCDTLLVVSSADAQWVYNDDRNRNDPLPMIALVGTRHHQGRVDVWVGTFGSQTCDATLALETWETG